MDWRRAGTRALRAAVIAAALALLTACGASAHRQGPVQTTPSPVAHPRPGPPLRIAVIVLENEEYGDIIGSRQTPYLNGLARRYALVRSLYATAHPSLPNYLALTGGSTFGITSDCTDCTVRGASNLGSQLTAAGIPWQAYMEDLPHSCFTGDGAGDYAKKHDPFLYYMPVHPDCEHVVPLSRLYAAERAGGGALPRFTWITPNLCHDMHDCGPAAGDRFMAGLVPPLLRALGPRGLLIVTWDEGSSDDGCCRLASGGHIATLLAGGAARRGARMATPADQYSILQTIEDLLGLRRLRGAACACTPSLAPLLRRAVVRSGSAARSRSAVRSG